MKTKILVSILAVVCFCFTADAKIIIKRHGSADGIHYKTVNETHGLFIDKLVCNGAGAAKCGWAIPPRIAGETREFSVEELLAMVPANEASGRLKVDGVTIEWRADMRNRGQEITITDKDGR